MPTCDPPRCLLRVGLAVAACGGDAKPAAADAETKSATADVKADRKAATEAKAPATDAKADDAKAADAKADAGKADADAGEGESANANAETGDALIFSDAAGLQLQSLADDKRTRLHAGAIGLCRHDERAGVIWFFASEAEGAPTVSLYAVDLHGDRKPVEVVADLPSEAEGLAITYGPSKANELTSFDEFGIGARVDVSGPPKVERFVGCGSDAYDCYESYEPAEVLYPEYEAIAKAVEKAKVVDAATIKTLAARDLKRPAPPTPALGQIPGFDKTACEEQPDDCGKTLELPGTGLSIVVVGNSRGDLYHEDLQLYDAKTKEFMPLSDPSKRSTTPLADSLEIERLWVSAGGEAYAYDDRLVHLTRGVRAEHVSICGFVEPGPELTGVTK